MFHSCCVLPGEETAEMHNDDNQDNNNKDEDNHLIENYVNTNTAVIKL